MEVKKVEERQVTRTTEQTEDTEEVMIRKVILELDLKVGTGVDIEEDQVPEAQIDQEVAKGERELVVWKVLQMEVEEKGIERIPNHTWPMC